VTRKYEIMDKSWRREKNGKTGSWRRINIADTQQQIVVRTTTPLLTGT